MTHTHTHTHTQKACLSGLDPKRFLATRAHTVILYLNAYTHKHTPTPLEEIKERVTILKWGTKTCVCVCARMHMLLSTHPVAFVGSGFSCAFTGFACACEFLRDWRVCVCVYVCVCVCVRFLWQNTTQRSTCRARLSSPYPKTTLTMNIHTH